MVEPPVARFGIYSSRQQCIREHAASAAFFKKKTAEKVKDLLDLHTGKRNRREKQGGQEENLIDHKQELCLACQEGWCPFMVAD